MDEEAPYVGFCAVVAADICVFLTEASVEFQLAEISQQLNSSALHGVLTEVDNAVKVVVVGCLGVSVSFVHCPQTKETLNCAQESLYTEKGSACLLPIILLMRWTSVYE